MTENQQNGIMDFIRGAWLLFKGDFRSILVVIVIFFFLPGLASLFVYGLLMSSLITIPDIFGFHPQAQAFIDSGFLPVISIQAALVLALVAFLVVACINSLGVVVLMRHLFKRSQGQVLSWQDSLSESMSRLFPFIGASILVGFPVYIGLAFIVASVYLLFALAIGGFSVPGYVYGMGLLGPPLFLGGFILFIYGYFTKEYVVIRGLSVWKALQASFALVKKRFWTIIGYLLLLMLFSWLASFAMSLVMMPLSFLLVLDGTGVFLSVISSSIQILYSYFLTTLFICISLVWFLNWDKQSA